MTVIAVINQKGGVGKTTLTANLAAAVALQEKTVLMIDLDPQANLSSHFGYQPDELKWTVFNALMKRPKDPFEQEINVLPYILQETGITHLSLAPSNLELSGAEIEMASVMGREALLKEVVEPLLERYDFIFIDCPPSLGLLSMNGLTAADQILIPFQTEYFATKGIQQLLDVVALVKRRRINPDLIVGGFIGCMFDKRKKLHQEVLSEVTGRFENQVYQTTIRNNVALAESTRQGKSIFESAPRSPGAQDYKALADEFLQRVKWD